MAAIILTIVFIALILLGAFFGVREVYRNWGLFKGAWSRLESFEKVSLQIGLMYYFAMELLKTHPAKDNFISSAFANILSALTEALFILGIIAFLKHAHDINKENKKP